jgi:PAS domain S-box-containing protein
MDAHNAKLSDFDFGLFADALEEVFWLMDPTGEKVLFVNSTYESMFGRSCQSLYDDANSFFENLISEDSSAIKQLQEKFYSKQGYEHTIRIKGKNNETIWIKCKTKPAYNAKNELRGYAGTAIDISDLKRTELQLRRTNHFFEKAGKMAKIGSFELDVPNKTLTWSNETKNIHEVEKDYEPNLVEAIHFYDTEFSREKISNAVSAAIEQGIDFDLELIIITAKGNKKWVRAIGNTEFFNNKCLRLFGTFQDINEIKLFEKGLQNESERLNNVLEGTLAGTWEWNIETGETIYNKRWAQLLGYDIDEIKPHKVSTGFELMHPDDIAGTDAKLNQYFRGECDLYEAEFRMKHKNGNWIWLQDRGKIFKWNAQGKPLMMAGTHQDITNRKLAEEQVRKLSKAIDQSPASIVITNLKGEIEYVNPYFSKITGYTFEEVIGKNPRFLKSGDKTEQDYEGLWKMITTGNKWSGEFKNKKKNGEEFWEYASISPIHNESGAITHFIAVKEEITFRKNAENMLKESEEKYRSLFDLSPFGMAALEQDNKVALINKKLFETIGYTAEEIKDLDTWTELVFPEIDYRKTIVANRIKAFADYKGKGIPTEPLEVEIKIKSGQLRTFELTYAFIGKYNIIIFNDISERKTYVETLEKQNNIFRDISWVQSHVVRAPLARLLGLFDLLMEKDFTLINEDKMLKHMKDSMEELDGHIKDISQKAYLVNHLADYSK